MSLAGAAVADLCVEQLLQDRSQAARRRSSPPSGSRQLSGMSKASDRRNIADDLALTGTTVDPAFTYPGSAPCLYSL